MITRLPLFSLLVLAILCPNVEAAAQYHDFELEIDQSPEFDTRDRNGMRRDTWYFVGYQWAVIGLLYLAPESVSGWSDAEKKGYNMSIWWDHVTHPHWDSDKLYLNYVLHPYWGAAYYVRARERGANDQQAFWYSAKLSSIYEFGAEALFERVSIQDLIVTPVGGTLVGRYFMTVRDRVRDRDVERGYRSTGDKWIWTLTDPLGALNQKVDKMTGRKLAVEFRPYYYAPQYKEFSALAPVNLESDTVYGIQVRIEW